MENSFGSEMESPKKDGTAVDAQVFVIGAGPVGLSAAVALRAIGLDVLVVEAEPENRVRPGSRALFLHKEPLKLLDDVAPGLAKSISEAGILWNRRRYTYGGKDVYVRSFPPLETIHYGASLPQVETERILMAKAEELGVRFLWGSPVADIETNPHGVVLTTESGKQLRASYGIGADGSRSATRKALGLKMEGKTHEVAFIIVDVDESPEHPLPLELSFHYEMPEIDGRNLLLVPFKGGWRVDLQCFPEDDVEAMSSEVGVREWLLKIMPAYYADHIRWITTYRFHRVIADKFTDPHHRILLAGEAAHLFPPFGGRGLNSGIVDATQSAHAIKSALEADDPVSAAKIIALCAEDRRSAAEFNKDAATFALNMLAPDSWVLKLRLRIASWLAPRFVKAGRWLSLGPTGKAGGRPGHQSSY